MFTLSIARQAFAEKLAREDDFNAAFGKAIWLAYKAGLKDAGGVIIYTDGINDSFIEIKKNANT